jgi:thiol:disulfide interchange protein DsbD
MIARAAVSLFLAAACTSRPASIALADDDFLPPEKAFTYLVEAEGDCLTVQWNVAPGYYLYKSRMAIESATESVKVGSPRFPKGENHHDEYFGDQEVFRDDFIVRAPLERTDKTTDQATVKLKWQGCADAGLCYPVTVWEATVRLRPAS